MQDGKRTSREMGLAMEEKAALYLAGQGMRIKERNFRSRQGEIDIIGYFQEYLVFVEVKYRKTDRTGSPESAVDRIKMKKICRTANYYRYLNGISDDSPFRYDVVSICGGQLTWYQDAFEHMTR